MALNAFYGTWKSVTINFAGLKEEWSLGEFSTNSNVQAFTYNYEFGKPVEIIPDETFLTLNLDGRWEVVSYMSLTISGTTIVYDYDGAGWTGTVIECKISDANNATFTVAYTEGGLVKTCTMTLRNGNQIQGDSSVANGNTFSKKG